MSLSSTAYATIAQAQLYMDGVLSSDSWDLATTDERTKALLNATRMIEHINFLGRKNDAEQELQFPRYNDTAIPDDIICACAAIAGALLDGVDPDIEFENLRLLQAGVNGAKSTYDSDNLPEHTVSGLGSFTAWAFLRPYTINNGTIELFRV